MLLALTSTRCRAVQRCWLGALLTFVAGCSPLTSLDGLDDGVRSDAGPAGTGGAGGSAHDAAEVEAGGSSGTSGAAGVSGAAGAADAGLDAAPDGPDLESDPLNCGALGHSCRGGECQQGRCAPFLLVQGQSRPTGITARQGFVYWANRDTGVILKTPRDHDATEVVVAPPDTSVDVFDVEADADHVYWSLLSGNAVWRKPLAGGAKEFLTTGSESAGYLALGADALYVTNPQAGPSDGAIVFTTRDGSQGGVLYAGLTPPTGIAVLGTVLHWAQQRRVVVGDTLGAAPAEVLTSDRDVQGLAYDGTFLYWIEGECCIRRKQPWVGVAEALYDIDPPFGTGDIAVDDESIYWTEPERGNVFKLAK